MQTSGVVEREAELAAFSRAMRRAAAGHGGVIAVTGAAGIGKTCVLEQVTHDAACAGWLVLAGRAPRVGPAHSLLLGLLDGIDMGAHPLDGPARAMHALRAGDGVTVRDLVLGMRWLLEDLVDERPVLLVADDVDRADAVSLQVLCDLREEVRSLGCLLVVAVTDDEPGDPRAASAALVDELVADARRVTPSPLSRDAVAAALTTAWPDATEEEVESLHRRSRGNPRVVADLLRIRCLPRWTPSALQEALHGLDELETEVLRLVCLDDDRPLLAELAGVVRRPLPELVTTCERLERERLLTLEDGRAAPHCPRVRTAVLGTTTRAAGVELHDRLAQVLLTAGAPSPRLVPHLLHSQPRANPDAREVLENEGRRALGDGDPHLAAALLRRAFDEGVEGSDDAGLVAALARALAALGDTDEAVTCWRRARAMAVDDTVALAYAASAADALADAGRAAEAVAAYAEIEETAPPAARRWVHDRILLAGYVSGLEAPGSAPAGTSPLATAFALAGRSRDSARVAALARQAAQDVVDGVLPPRSLLLATALLAATTAFDEAEAVLTGTMTDLTEARTGTVATVCRGFVRVRAGRVTEGLADLTEVADQPPVAGPAQAAAQLAAVIEGRIARGDLAEATLLADRLAKAPVTAGIGAALARHTLAEVASASGDDPRAIELYTEAGRRLGPDVDNPALLAWRVGAAFAEIRAGSPARALALARENLVLAQQFAAAYAEAQALRTLAAVDVTVDRIGLLRHALDLAGRASAPRLRSQIETDLAALLILTPGGGEEALRLLRAADEYAADQELAPLQARARRLLARLGEEPARRRSELLSTLTSGERRTARLAAAGRTNQQIADQLGVSVKAVEWHLSGCYRKLGIRSRRQLSAVLHAA